MEAALAQQVQCQHWETVQPQDLVAQQVVQFLQDPVAL
jgi:hypothetical protein